jgi:hypothetical protein
MRRFSKEIWIERTGGSISLVARFLEIFPDAQFIHVLQDGRDAAISMREHLAFRLVFAMMTLTQTLGVNPYQSEDRSQLDRVPLEWLCFLPEEFDSDAIRAFRMPTDFFCKVWADNTVTGLNVLNKLPAGRVIAFKYEAILATPKAELDKTSAFLG